MTLDGTPLQIAIDGPVASGKSTVARLLAHRLRCAFLDTGALYRAVAAQAIRQGIPPDDEAKINDVMDAGLPEIVADPASRLGYEIKINHAVITPELFAADVSRAVSAVAAMPSVRRRLLAVQRDFADARDVIMAGRDIGSVVLPGASVKFFLTASLDSRVDRRLEELRSHGARIERETLRAELIRRDERDRGRPVSPLVKVADAIEIDTSEMTVEEVVDRLERLVRSRTRLRS